MNSENGFLWPALTLNLAFLLASGTARSASLSYQAPEGCPNQAEFVEAVGARGGQFSASPLPAQPAFDVLIERDSDSGFDGTLQIRGASQNSGSRQVHGASCTEVVDALAIVAAIALRTESEHAAEAPLRLAEQSRATVAAAKPTARAPLRASGRNTWPSPFHLGNVAVNVDAGTARFESVTNVTPLFGVALGVVPGAAVPRLDVELTRVNFVSLPGGESYMLAPVLRFRASLLADTSVRSGEFTSQIGGQAIAFSPCYAPFYDSGGFGVLLCVELAIEIFGIRSRDGAGRTVQNKTIGVGTAGLGADLTYNIGRHLQFGLKFGLDGATNPITAERADGSELFRSSWLSGYGMLGFGAHW